jgi:hypothetical protein
MGRGQAHLLSLASASWKDTGTDVPAGERVVEAAINALYQGWLLTSCGNEWQEKRYPSM